jgi:recombination protein RecA
MPTAAALRAQIEAALASRIPSALSPTPRLLRPLAPTGISRVDELLAGGLPLGAITELVGPECSGRTTLALSFLAGLTAEGKVCAWVDVSDTLDPQSAAAMGVDLHRLLWVRCCVEQPGKSALPQPVFALPEKCLTPPPVKKGLHGGGFGPHPRSEVKGMPDAVQNLLDPQFAGQALAPRCAESLPRIRRQKEAVPRSIMSPHKPADMAPSRRPWPRMEQALRVTDLLLQTGGFSSIVLDMGSLPAEHASRVPLATWFRYRAAAEQSQGSIVLLTQHACAKSSAELVLCLEPAAARDDASTVFTGFDCRVEVARERFSAPQSNVLPLRKPPQRATIAGWQTRTTWAGKR